MRHIILGCWLTVGAGCSVPSPPPPDAWALPPSRRLEDKPHSPADRTSLLKELERQQARWWKGAPLAYQLTVSRRCFCDVGTPWVSRNDGADVISSRGGHFRDGRNIGPPLRTVEQLFAEAARAARSNADGVEVTFDPRFGYPARISIDSWRDSEDDELEWIAELTVLR